MTKNYYSTNFACFPSFLLFHFDSLFMYKWPISVLKQGVFFGQNGRGQKYFAVIWSLDPLFLPYPRGHCPPRFFQLEPPLSVPTVKSGEPFKYLGGFFNFKMNNKDHQDLLLSSLHLIALSTFSLSHSSMLFLDANRILKKAVVDGGITQC